MSSRAIPSNYLEMPVHHLKRGMYVAELDRPWLETPFAVQGFYVTTDEEIHSLAEHCSVVFVDPRRVDRGRPQPVSADRSGIPLREQFQAAKVDYESASDAVQKVFTRLKHGSDLDIGAVAQAVEPLIRGVVRHREALAALVRMRRKDDYLYNHAISTAVWAALIGQQLGLNKAQLESLTLGAAIQDLGTIKIRDALLAKPGALTEPEWRVIRQHVNFSLSLIADHSAVAPEVLLLIKHHHERYDGSGYPSALVGSKIPLLAQIAGLADTYDAMLTPRPYRRAHTSFSAVQEIIDLKDTQFSKPLVEQFVQAVGLFPTGCLVELNTGEVGIVVAQNAVRRLRPKVMLVLDSSGQRLLKMSTIDLMKYEIDNRGRDPLWISKELETGSHGLDPAEFFL